MNSRTPHTVVALDADGVVVPRRTDEETAGLVKVGTALRPVWVDPEVCGHLQRIVASAEVTGIWLTSWLPHVRLAMSAPFPGRGWPQLPITPQPSTRWPKWSALRAWVAARPALRRLAWIDDELDAPYGPHRALRQDTYAGWLTARGVDSQLLAPDSVTGLTRDHLRLLTEWLSTTGTGAPRGASTAQRPGDPA